MGNLYTVYAKDGPDDKICSLIAEGLDTLRTLTASSLESQSDLEDNKTTRHLFD